MGKIAFVFSGQGDQYVGMGSELFERYDAAKTVFLQCDRLRPGTMEQCFRGSEDALKETKNTQACLFAMEYAAASVLLERGVRPQAVAGFSLGEVTAAAAAGLFDPELGFRLVCRRGELMQAAAEQHETSMAAVLKLSVEAVKELCSRFEGVYPVNFNCPGQITVSGLSAQMPAFFAEVKTMGGRAIPLKVTGAFHSPFMTEAADRFAAELSNVVFRQPDVRLYSNVTAKPYTDDAAGLLSKQICSPVMWEQLVRHMIADGVDTFIEIGPGRTLCNMMKKIDETVKTYAVSDMELILSEVGVC